MRTAEKKPPPFYFRERALGKWTTYLSRGLCKAFVGVPILFKRGNYRGNARNCRVNFEGQD